MVARPAGSPPPVHVVRFRLLLGATPPTIEKSIGRRPAASIGNDLTCLYAVKSGIEEVTTASDPTVITEILKALSFVP